jgi:thioredoxin reductase (NADPH)
VIGHRWSAKAYALKDFLARNQVPYQWLNIEEQVEAQKLLEYIGSTSKKLPVVIFPDDSYLVDPDTTEVAEKVSLKTHAETRFYDLLIVGSGPAGLAAGVYAASEGLRTLLVEKNAPGGQAGSSSHIDNYLGFPAGLSGTDLARRAVTQAERFGAEIVTPQEVTSIRVHGQYRIVALGDGSEITCNAILLATGVAYRQLEVTGIEQLNGMGVYYGASTTEGIACQDEEIFIVGGANSAGQAALYFSKYARKVTILVRGKSLSSSMSRYLVEQIEETENIEVCACTSVVAISGEKHLEGMTLRNEDSREEHTIEASSLFIFIGAQPHTEQFANLLQRDEHGFLLTGPDLRRVGPNRWALKREPYLLESSVPGIFVAGDVRANSIKRVAAGVGEGSMAVQFIERYLKQA